MNKQKGPNKIGWTEVFGEGSGRTANPVGGCHHDCQWLMPTYDAHGQAIDPDKILEKIPDYEPIIATCYAGDVAEGVARAAYPHGFKHHYWHPDRLAEFARTKQRCGIFIDSMSDLFGAWVPREQIVAVMDAAREADWHVFQSLTKNPKRLIQFVDQFPPNWWIGVSSPPDFMFGKPMAEADRERFFLNTLAVLHAIKLVHPKLTVWLSLEPLTIDAGSLMTRYFMLTGFRPDWLIVGAASNGKAHYQPEYDLVEQVHLFADRLGDKPIPVYHKENLDWRVTRREFPVA